MASLQERNGSYRVLFCYHGKLHSFTLGKSARTKPRTRPGKSITCSCGSSNASSVLPEGTDIVTFVAHDGRPVDLGPTLPTAPRQVVTLGHLQDRYPGHARQRHHRGQQPQHLPSCTSATSPASLAKPFPSAICHWHSCKHTSISVPGHS